MGAKFDLKQVPGLYEGRPDRYFDDTADPRRRTQQGVEDSDYTRQVRRGGGGVPCGGVAGVGVRLPFSFVEAVVWVDRYICR